ncbi:hypothetical protein HYPDE_41303 [Hyphomicrobium denitrificans 1NES1]|uniref:TIR domain-containing protein n=1 Tax=Hyphomicrobium denitrificans 1NES1 TaxID=670307 RepID=N0B8I7_9HYPH|nr:hypothetical protein HYPDE_41303 [Hyphomicrobium denitrificans 1NES1]
MREVLKRYGISSFVAHDDIKVSAKWRDEILRSLHSMDAFVAIITKDFSQSNWTDQEVGIAVCRDVLIIPLDKGAAPYGFIGELQAEKTGGDAVEVAEKVFTAIKDSPKTRDRIIECLSKTIAASADSTFASFRVDKLASIENVPRDAWETVRQNVPAYPALMGDKSFVDKLNKALVLAGIAPVGDHDEPVNIDDEIPF